MNQDIAFTLLVVLLTLVAFIREWAPPDVLALSILCLLVALGLVDMKDMSSVFRNEAPLTIAALFVIGGALEKSGAVDQIGRLLQHRVKGGVRASIFAFSVVATFFSAWMNNRFTPWLRACITACANSLAPRPLPRWCGDTVTPNSAQVAHCGSTE